MRTRNILITSTAAVIAAVAIGASGAQAAAVDLFGSNDIQDDSVRSVDVKDQTLRLKDLRPGAVEALSGDSGASGLTGAHYATAFYNAGNTNAGAVATVACDPTDTDYVAISGGVQTLALDGTPLDNNTPVSSSFPGRMDWDGADDIPNNADDNQPRPDRLDGWIVQFGGNAGATSDNDPVNAKVWALCVPGADVPVQQTYSQVG